MEWCCEIPLGAHGRRRVGCLGEYKSMHWLSFGESPSVTPEWGACICSSHGATLATSVAYKRRPPAFLYTDDELLAELLLRWGDLSLKAKKQLLKEVEAESAKKVRGAR